MSAIECEARGRFGFIRWLNEGNSNTFFKLLVILLLIPVYKEERHFVKTSSKILNKGNGPCVKWSKGYGKFCNKLRPFQLYFLFITYLHNVYQGNSQSYAIWLFSRQCDQNIPSIKKKYVLWLGLGVVLQTQRSPVWFPVRAHAWVVGQVPTWGQARGNWSMLLCHIYVSLPLFLPFPHFLKKISALWLVWLSGLSASLQTKGLLVQFPVRAHAWIVGQVPSGGHVRGNHTLMFLSLSFSLLSPLSKNK